MSFCPLGQEGGGPGLLVHPGRPQVHRLPLQGAGVPGVEATLGRHDLLGRPGPQAGEEGGRGGGGAGEGRPQGPGGPGGPGQGCPPAQGRPGQGDGPVEEAAGPGGQVEVVDARPAGRQPRQGDQGGVPAERPYVRLHPAQGRHLVQEAEVARRLGVLGGQETQGTQAVLGEAGEAGGGRVRVAECG